MKVLHFGAGNIGRGFIGLLLQKAGYEVCFVDVNQTIVEELNKKREYTVEIADDLHQVILVQGVRAVNGQDEPLVIEEIIQADLITTALGPNILPYIAPALAKGLEQRLKRRNQPLNIIACENMVGGTSFLKQQILKHLDPSLVGEAEEKIGFPDAAVDRIIPLQKNKDPLHVIVEPFYEWVVDETKWVGLKPTIEGITFVDGLLPYIERKLFTVNTGHATAAYLGYHEGCKTIDEALDNKFVNLTTKHVLEETGHLLIQKYQFDPNEHQQYIKKILSRFINPYLSDEVTRIGRSPIRKLKPTDRFISPAVQCMNIGLVPENLCTGIAAAFLFDYTEDAEAQEIQSSIRVDGLDTAITKYTSLSKENTLHQLIREKYKQLRS
jgi:mannitol-1-phosphate 5-dehydrogenase